MQQLYPSEGRFFGSMVRERHLGDRRLMDKRHAAGERLPWHSHPNAYVTLVLKGGYRECIGLASSDCPPGTAIVHPPGEAHSDAFGMRATRLLAIELPPDALPPGHLRDAFQRRSVLRSPEVSLWAVKLARELWIADQASHLVVESVLLELTAQVLRRESLESASAPPWLKEAEALVRERCCEPLSVARVAQELDVDPATLARGFRRHRGRTVGETIRRARIEQTLERLRGSAPLTQIALEAGFADQSHFTRTFARLMGTTPGAYRRSVRRRSRTVEVAGLHADHPR